MSESVKKERRSKVVKKPSRPRLRLAGKMVFAVLVSLVLVEIAWLSASYKTKSSRLAEEVETRARLLLAAAVDPRSFPTLSNEIAVIERLKPVAHIAGARLEDTAGEPLAVVGDAPDLTVLQAQHDKITFRMSAGRRFLDVYVPAKEIKFDHAMVVRVDLAPAYAELRRSLLSEAITVVNIVVLTSTGLFFALYPLLFRPLARIRDAIICGVNDLDIADQFVIRWKRKDELDDLAKAVNRLLYGASKNYNDMLQTAHDVVSKSPIAALVYTPEGEVGFANKAAFEMFGVESTEEFGALDQAFLTLNADEDEVAPPETVQKALAKGPYCDEGRVLTWRGSRHMICMGATINRMDGSVRRYIAQFLDMDLAMPRIAKLAVVSERATQRRILADKRSMKLRVMLESCLTILGEQDEQEKYDIGIVEADQVIIAWAQAYASVGMARRVLYNRLPELSGNRRWVAILFRQALSYTDFSSAYRNSEIKVISSTDGPMARFSFTEILTEESTRKAESDATGRGELTLCRAALARAVEYCSGELALDEAADAPVKFVITIPRVMHLVDPDAGEEDSEASGEDLEAA